MGDIFGQILRDLLGGKGGQVQAPAGLGAAVFGDRFDAGPDVQQDQLDELQKLVDRFAGASRR
jgi:hypothetical protein